MKYGLTSFLVDEGSKAKGALVEIPVWSPESVRTTCICLGFQRPSVLRTFEIKPMLNPKPSRSRVQAVLGGPWDLVTTYNWDYNPTYNCGNPYKPI